MIFNYRNRFIKHHSRKCKNDLFFLLSLFFSHNRRKIAAIKARDVLQIENKIKVFSKNQQLPDYFPKVSTFTFCISNP